MELEKRLYWFIRLEGSVTGEAIREAFEEEPCNLVDALESLQDKGEIQIYRDGWKNYYQIPKESREKKKDMEDMLQYIRENPGVTKGELEVWAGSKNARDARLEPLLKSGKVQVTRIKNRNMYTVALPKKELSYRQKELISRLEDLAKKNMSFSMNFEGITVAELKELAEEGYITIEGDKWRPKEGA